jgi:hypothetical protein
MVENFQIGIATFSIEYECQGINAMTSIRKHMRWIEKNKSLLEGKVLIINNSNTALIRSCVQQSALAP